MVLYGRVILFTWFLFSILSCNTQGGIELDYDRITQIMLEHIPKKTSSIAFNTNCKKFEFFPFNERVLIDNDLEIEEVILKPIVFDSMISNFHKFNIQSFEVTTMPYGKDSLKEKDLVYIEYSDFFLDNKSDKGLFFIRFLCGRLCGGECYFLFKGREANMEMVESFCTNP